MAIQFQCGHCDQTIRVKPEYAGRSASCPGCQQKIRIPASSGSERPTTKDPAKTAARTTNSPAVPQLPGPAEATPRPRKAVVPTGKPAAKAKAVPKPEERLPDGPAEPRSVHEMVMQQFTGPIKPVRRTVLYRAAVIVVAAAVVVLPVLYVSLIGLLGWGVYWHAVTNTEVASMGTGRGRGVAVMAYVAPIFAGSVAVLFMLKPLFARAPQHFQQVSLNRARQPLLFAFVEKICDTVHAPRPSRIDLAFNINASAGFSQGWFSLIRSELVLTIGMPLVAGLSLQQFAGILAHEFGHFSQGTAMRAQWVVMSVNMWFARIVYARDAWDEWLEETSHELDLRIGWVLYFARFVVFLSRRVLWCFMMLSYALSCGMSRLMEYDADRYETRLVGTKTFESTSKRLFELNYAAEQFFRSLWQGQVPETGNIARDMVRHCDKLDHVDEKRMKRRLKREKTGWFDTHPSTADRIASSRKEDAPGVFHSDLSADVVFNGFDQLCLSLQQRP